MKFIKYIIIVLFIFILSGCKDNNKLVCTSKNSSIGVDTKQTISMKFKNEKINKLELKINIKPTEEKIKKYWDVFIEELGKQYSIYDEIEGIKSFKTIDNDKYEYTVSIDIDLKTINESDLEKLGLNDIIKEDLKKEDIKKNIENEDFTCS